MLFITTRRVEFRDTDAAGIVHFSAFFPMMEAAEHELLRSLSIPILPRNDQGHSALTWPRVAADCNYSAAARFEDVLRIETQVSKIGTSSVQYSFRFLRDPQGLQAAQQTPVLVAMGTLTAVACRLCPSGGLVKVQIPTEIRDLLGRYSPPPHSPD